MSEEVQIHISAGLVFKIIKDLAQQVNLKYNGGDKDKPAGEFTFILVTAFQCMQEDPIPILKRHRQPPGPASQNRFIMLFNGTARASVQKPVNSLPFWILWNFCLMLSCFKKLLLKAVTPSDSKDIKYRDLIVRMMSARVAYWHM